MKSDSNSRPRLINDFALFTGFVMWLMVLFLFNDLFCFVCIMIFLSKLVNDNYI